MNLDDLTQFSGTTDWHQHPLGLMYTDGVQFLAEEGGAYWLLDLICSYQPRLRRDPMLRDMQFWHLTVNADKSAVVTCRADSDYPPAVEQHIPWTDFPLAEVDVWVEGVVMLLPSEH